MTEFPETRNSLIVQIQDASEQEAWDQFASIYRPVIYRLARARGMQDADAQDLAQRVLTSVASKIDSWEKLDPPVRFRHWLRKVTRNAILNGLTRKPKDQACGGTTVQELLLEHASPEIESTSQIELEYRRELYLRAATIVKKDVHPQTWRAFELTVVQQVPIPQAAQEINCSLGAIYTARSRVIRRLREVTKYLDGSES